VTTSNPASAKFRKAIFLHALAKMGLKPKNFWMHLNLQLKLEATETSLCPMKSALDVLDREPQDHGPAMRAGCRRACLEQPVDQPLHLFGRQLHVDLDGGTASEACGNIIA
jgi:hypothetical protein